MPNKIIKEKKIFAVCIRHHQYFKIIFGFATGQGGGRDHVGEYAASAQGRTPGCAQRRDAASTRLLPE